MHKIKQAIAELRAYLNADQEGIRKLDVITNIANDMRKDLAASNKASQSAQQSAALAVANLEAANREVESLTNELDNCNRRRLKLLRHAAATNAEIRELEARLRDATAEDIPELPEAGRSQSEASWLFSNTSELMSLVRSLRQEMRCAPRNLWIERERDLIAFELTDIIKSYSSNEILRLGRFVAVLALMNMRPVIISTENIGTTPAFEAQRRRWDDPADDSVGPVGKFCQWFRDNMTSQNRLSRGVSMKHAARNREEDIRLGLRLPW